MEKSLAIKIFCYTIAYLIILLYYTTIRNNGIVSKCYHKMQDCQVFNNYGRYRNSKGSVHKFIMFYQPKSFTMGEGVAAILRQKKTNNNFNTSMFSRKAACVFSFKIEGAGGRSYPKRFRQKKLCEIIIQSLRESLGNAIFSHHA